MDAVDAVKRGWKHGSSEEHKQHQQHGFDAASANDSLSRESSMKHLKASESKLVSPKCLPVLQQGDDSHKRSAVPSF